MLRVGDYTMNFKMVLKNAKLENMDQIHFPNASFPSRLQAAHLVVLAVFMEDLQQLEIKYAQNCTER